VTHCEMFSTVAPSDSMGDTASPLDRRGEEESVTSSSNMQRRGQCPRMHVRLAGYIKEHLACFVSRADQQRRRRFTLKPMKLQRHAKTASLGSESAVMSNISQ